MSLETSGYEQLARNKLSYYGFWISALNSISKNIIRAGVTIRTPCTKECQFAPHQVYFAPTHTVLPSSIRLIQYPKGIQIFVACDKSHL